MRILITGATGFIGSHLSRALCQHHEVLACVRDPAALEKNGCGIKTVIMDFSMHHTVDDWLPLLKDFEVVINAVGIIRETRRQTFERLHREAPCTLFNACERAGVKRVIQISALGADEAAFSEYHLSKRVADDCLRQQELDWVILQPSLVYGSGGGSSSFFAALSALPLTPVVGDGLQLVQPIHIDDLTQAVCALLTTEAPLRITMDAVGPDAITVRDMLFGYRRWLGLTSRRVLPIPYGLSLFAGKLGGFLGDLPLTAETIQMLERGNAGDVTKLKELLHRTPRTFEEGLREHPAQQADRWHARLLLLRPLLRFTIGVLWLFTGIVSLGLYPVEQSYRLLAQVGVSGTYAPIALYGAALLDIGLGAATLARYRIQLVGYVQIALMLCYSLLISAGLSELWLHPFGPITKNIPLIVATMIMLALEKD